MQDGVTNTQVQPNEANNAPAQNEIPIEIRTGLAMAFGEQLPSEETQITQQADGGAAAQTTTAAADTTQTQQSAQPVFNEVEYLKTNFGWETPEVAKTELEEREAHLLCIVNVYAVAKP